MPRRSAGIAGSAVLFGTAGLYLAYVGIKDVPFVDGLRDMLRQKTPSPRDLHLPYAPTGKAFAGVDTVSSASTGKIVSVNGIMVDSSIAGNLSRLLTAAKIDGINFGGGGHRTSLMQAAARIRNGCTCPDRSDCCRRPTAPVGKSMHEQGLAVDFTVSGRSLKSSDKGYKWLVANAGKYGLKNLPGEPWHWSVNGK